jgi:hypothetical protein
MNKIPQNFENYEKFKELIDEVSIYYTFYDIYEYKGKYYALCGSGIGFELIPVEAKSNKECMSFWDNGNSTWNDIFEGFKKMIEENKKDNQEEYHEKNCFC